MQTGVADKGGKAMKTKLYGNAIRAASASLVFILSFRDVKLSCILFAVIFIGLCNMSLLFEVLKEVKNVRRSKRKSLQNKQKSIPKSKQKR